MVITGIVQLILLIISYLFVTSDFAFKEIPNVTFKDRTLHLVRIILLLITIYFMVIIAIIKSILIVIVSIIFYALLPIIAVLAIFYWLAFGKHLFTIWFKYHLKLCDKIWN